MLLSLCVRLVLLFNAEVSLVLVLDHLTVGEGVLKVLAIQSFLHLFPVVLDVCVRDLLFNLLQLLLRNY